jgi:hypothetical protein
MAVGEVNPIALPIGLPGSAPAGETRAAAPESAWPWLPMAVKASGPVGKRLVATPGRSRRSRTMYGALQLESPEAAAPQRARTRW